MKKKTPHISPKALARQLERHHELLHSWEEELEMAEYLQASNILRLKKHIIEEKAEIRRKKKLLDTFN